MKRFFYAKIALTNLKKNRQTYFPYLLTCIATVSYTHLSKEAFSESVKMNTALIRKRIRNAKMKAEEKQVGRYSATTTALLYLDGVVYLPICEEMRKRLDAFEVDGIEDGGMIEYLTRKKKEGRFPVCLLYTSRCV